MFAWIKQYFSKEARKERVLRQAKAKQRSDSLRKLKKQLTALKEATKHMDVISDALASSGSGRKKVVNLDFAISRLVWAFCDDANWWDDPHKERDDLTRFIKMNLGNEQPVALLIVLVAEFVILTKALLQVFYADSFKIAVTYSGLSQEAYNGRFEMWKHDAGKAKALLDLLNALPEQRTSSEMQKVYQVISGQAERISAYQPAGEVPEFDYSISQMTANAMAHCVPKNDLARDRNLPVGRTVGDSTFTASPLASGQIKIIPYTWLSVVFNKLQVDQFRNFLNTHDIWDAARSVARQVTEAIGAAIQQTRQRITEVASIP